MQPENPNAWAVWVDAKVYYFSSIDELRRWCNQNHVSNDHDVWSPTEQRWKKLGDLKLADSSIRASELVSTGCGWLFLGSAALWLGFSCFVAPFRRDESARDSGPVAALHADALLTFNDINMRIEPQQGANVRIYITRKAFEDIPFPDRPNAVEALGQRWCSSVDGFFLPSMYICDIRTGKELAHYDCTWYNIKEWWRRKNKTSSR